ncbi:MAG: alpha/beta hydrolase [Gammaproteobacteria bacterium]
MYKKIVTLLILGIIGLSGCAAISQPEPTEAIVEILYATDRNLTGKQDAKSFYGVERGEMSYGFCEVAINIERGRSEFADHSIWRVGFEGKPGKRGDLRNITKLDKDDFFRHFTDRINNSKDKSALVYIHGYYRTFEIAARTAATLTFEIRYQGIPVLYSWPSRHELSAYQGDTTTIDWSTAHLRAFLVDIARQTNAQTIHVVAHSLGNRGFVNAFIDVLKNPAITDTWKFGEIVLVAPDLDRQTFERDIAPIITKAPSRITLYVSSVDVPLWASKTVNLYPRLGDASEEPIIIERIQTIDASQVVNLATGHTYYRENQRVMEDLYYLINERRDASLRPTLEAVESPGGRYWVVKEEITH